MRTILLAMTALTALAAASPAAAQYRQANANVGIDGRIGELDARLDAGIRRGSISRSEASPLTAELRSLTRLERQYSRNGLTRDERQDLRQRSTALRERIRIAEQSGGYAGRDGRWEDRDDRDGRNCPPGLERRNNGCVPPGQEGRDGRWEDRRDDRDGRWEDRRDDRDGRWEDRRDDRDDSDGRWQDRDRRGGIVDRVTDRISGNSALRVGQRASSGLGAVPYALRDRYRDGNGVYFRADARNVYRIDARTHVVAQVYAM